MTDPLTKPRCRRRWPRPSRAPLRTDIATGFAMFMTVGMVYLWQTVRYSWVGWAGDVPRAEVDAAHLTSIAWNEGLLLAALVIAGLAALFLAPWTAVSQVLAAAVLAVLLAAAQHGYDQSHPAPAPAPSVMSSPCYSGSGTCH